MEDDWEDLLALESDTPKKGTGSFDWNVDLLKDIEALLLLLNLLLLLLDVW